MGEGRREEGRRDEGDVGRGDQGGEGGRLYRRRGEFNE